MSRDEEDEKSPQPEEAEQVSAESMAVIVPGTEGISSDVVSGVDEGVVAGEVGVEKYVHAAFIAAALLSAFLGGKVLLSLWNNLAEWPQAVRSLPFLIEYTEEERGTWTLIIGAVLGVLGILRYYRRPNVRSWATSVAGELARVTWPSKDTVTNGTIVVLIAGAIATVYIALLDRLWGYLTNLVYGA